MKHTLAFLTALLLAPLAGLDAAETPKQKPKILHILADDMGYSALSCYGNKDIATPNLDRLASQGMRFTSADADAQCSPTRAAFFSGQYGARSGVFKVIHEQEPPKAFLRIPTANLAMPPDVATLATTLRKAGYTTGLSGKWHIADDYPAATLRSRDGGKYFDRYDFDFRGAANEKDQVEDKAVTAITDDMLGFIEAHGAQPWFIYLACHEPHVQVIPTEESDSLTRTASDDPLRQKCPGVLHDLDAGVGIVRAKLRALKLAERTLVVFLSDNGAPLDALEVAQQAGQKLKAPEAPKPDGKTKPATDAENDDKAVNGSCNDPLRGRKGLMWEGGIRVPLVMAWRGTLPAGQVFDHPVINLDIAATALAAADTAPLASKQLDGVNLLPFLKGDNKTAPHERLFWRYADRNLFAVREGNWKLVQSHTPTAQLFDLSADISERKDLSSQHPEIVQRLQTAWDAWNATLKSPALDKASVKKGKTKP